MKVKQIVGETADRQQVYKADQEMREKNPQYAAEVAKLPSLIRGIGPDSQKHNAMVWGEIAKILQKYNYRGREFGRTAISNRDRAVNIVGINYPSDIANNINSIKILPAEKDRIAGVLNRSRSVWRENGVNLEVEFGASGESAEPCDPKVFDNI